MTQPPLEWTEDPTKMVDYDAVCEYSNYVHFFTFLLMTSSSWLKQDDFDDVLEEIRSKVGEDERKETYRWISSHKDTFGDCFYPDGADLVEKIAEKSGCVMIVEWLTSDVMIGAPNGEKLQYGINLLEKLEEFHVCPKLLILLPICVRVRYCDADKLRYRRTLPTAVWMPTLSTMLTFPDSKSAWSRL